MRHVSTANLWCYRLATVCVAVLVMASPFVRAQKPPAAPPAVPTTVVTGATMDRVRAAGTIRVGYRADAQPFSYRDNAGQPAGYAIALCQKIGDAVRGEPGPGRVRVEWVPVAPEQRVTAVQQGEIDLFCGPDAITLAARQDVAFSIPVFPGGVGALVRGDAPVRLRDVLAGRAAAPSPLWRAHATQTLQAHGFAVVRGSATERWLAGRMKDLGVAATVAPVSGLDAGVQAVRDGKADVFFGERSVLLDAARRSPSPGELVVIDRLFTYAPLAMAFRRGDEGFRLLVDRTLSQIYGSGEIDGLYAKWFGEPDGNAMTFFRWNTLPE